MSIPPNTVVPRNISTFFSSVVVPRNGRLSSTLPNTAAISDFIS